MDATPLQAVTSQLEEMLSGNKLVVKPRLLWEVLLALPSLDSSTQATVLQQLLLAAQQVLHNACALALDSGRHHGASVVDYLLQLSMNWTHSEELARKVLQLVATLVEQVGVRRSNAYIVYEYLAKAGSDADAVRAALAALRTVLQPSRQTHPSHYFYFSGAGCGLELSTRPFDSYPFLKGLSMCLWLRLEEYQTNTVSRLFVFHSKDYGGLEGYFVRNRLYYRTLPASEYTPPVEGSNGILLYEFRPEVWTYIAFEHERNLMSRQSLRVVVDGIEVLSTTMDMPKPKSKSPSFSKAGLCLDFTGQLACVMVFEGPLEVQKMKAIYSHYTFGPEGQESLRSLFRILDKALVPKLVMFYHPLRTAGGVVFEGAREADGKLLGVSGVKQSSPSRISYLGGICSLLPIVSRINEIPFSERFTLLTEWAQLLFLCLKDRPENQMEAVGLKFFKVLAEVLSTAQKPPISVDFVKLIRDLNFTLMPHLREQLAVHFLWALDLWKKTEVEVQMKLWELLKYLYATAPKALGKCVGVARILDLISANFEVKEAGCCAAHGGSDHSALSSRLDPLFSIMESVLTSSDSSVKDIKSISAFLFSKPAPCVQNHLLHLIKSLITPRPGEVVGPPPQAVAKSFLEEKGMELLLFLLSNSTADVARVSLACVDTLMTHHLQLVTTEFLTAAKGFAFTTKDIVAYIGTVMIPKPLDDGKRESSPTTAAPPSAKMQKVKPFSFQLREESLSSGDGKLFPVPELSGPPQAPSMINRRKPNIRFQFGDEDEEVKTAPTPPAAPKQQPKPDFLFPTDSEKSAQPLDPPMKTVKSFSSRKEKPAFALAIDTDKVNENYAYGGEQAVLKTEESPEQKLRREISELAKECVKYIRGELVQESDSRLFPLPPAAIRPQSVRGLKRIDFPLAIGPNCETISEESGDLSPISTQKEQKRNPAEDLIYRTILEMVLHRTLPEGALLDDTDIIANPLALELLFSLANSCSMAVRQRVLQDLLVLTKWNNQNSATLGSSQAWHFFALRVLMQAQAQTTPEMTLVWDMGTRLQTAVLKQIVLVDEDGWKCVSKLQTWVESQSEDRQAARATLRHILESLFESLKSNTMGCRPSTTSTLWRNIAALGFLLEEWVVRSTDVEGETIMQLRLWQHCEELGVLARYFDLLESMWPLSLFEESPEILASPDFQQLLDCIQRWSREGLKLDLQLLVLEPATEFKSRGALLKALALLAVIGLAASSDLHTANYWAGIVARVGKLVLLVAEAGKKALTSALSKAMCACFLFVLGALQEVCASPNEVSSQAAKDCLTSLLSCLFAVYTSYSSVSPLREKPQGVFTNILTSQKITSELAESVLESCPGAPLLTFSDLDQMKRRNFEGLQEQLDKEEWRAGLEKLYISQIPQFLSDAKVAAMAQVRKKHADSLLSETRAFDLKKDEVLRDLQNRVLTTAAERSDKEDQRRIGLTVYEQEKARQRKEHWKRVSSKLTQWRGAWRTGKAVSLQPFGAMDQTLSRPFLKVRTETARHMLGQESHGSLVSNPTEYLTEVATQNKIRKSTSFAQLEDDESSILDLEEAELPAEELKLGASLLSYYSSEPHLIQRECGWVTPMFVRYGLLQIVDVKGEKKLRFVLDERGDKKFQSHIAMFKYCPPSNKSYIKEWSLDGLKEVLPRTYVLRHSACECFFYDGRSALFNFSSQSDREKVVKKIERLKHSAVPVFSAFKHPAASKLIRQKDVTDRWMEWKISNFEYIMHLNFLAGRSFNDITQYPVFPWVVAEYAEPSLDLRNHRVYRDLSRPMGALGDESRYSFFKDRFNSIDPTLGTPKFHFGSHYSNPGIVLYYLLRLFPFTEAEKELQGGRFDLPDRLFMSVAESFRSATEDISDVRELIPEFYFQPEFLMNIDNHDFGTTQSGMKVDHVDLPKWAANAFEFVRVHREALESDQVSYALHHWIDLVFGYKQRGAEAEKALNTFYYMTYEESVDLDKIEDEKLRVSTEAQIVNFGKTPSQLFDKPHPQRRNRSKLQPGPSVVSASAQLKIYYPSSRQQLQRTLNLYNYHELPGRALIKARFCSDNRIVALRNSGTLVLYRWWSTPVMGDFKTPFTCAIEKEKRLGRDYRSAGIETRDRSVQGLNAPVLLMREGNIIVQGGFWDGRISVQKSSERDQPTPSCNHYNTVTALDLDVDERVAVTGSKDGDCIVWQVDGEYWKARWHFIEHEAPITSVAVSTTLNAFASCSLDGSCNIYSLRKGRLLSVITHPETAAWYNVVFSPAAPAKVILFSARTNALYSFGVNGGLICKAQERASFVISPIVVRDLNQAEFLVYGTEMGEVVIRTAGNFTLIKRVTIVSGVPILTILPTPDLRFLLAGCADGELTVLTDPTATLSLFESQWQSRDDVGA